MQKEEKGYSTYNANFLSQKWEYSLQFFDGSVEVPRRRIKFWKLKRKSSRIHQALLVESSILQVVFLIIEGMFGNRNMGGECREFLERLCREEGHSLLGLVQKFQILVVEEELIPLKYFQ